LHSKDAGLHLQSCGEGDQPYGHLQGQSMWGTVSGLLNRLFHRSVFVTTFGYSAQKYITTLKYRHYTCCILRYYVPLYYQLMVLSTLLTVCVGICTLSQALQLHLTYCYITIFRVWSQFYLLQYRVVFSSFSFYRAALFHSFLRRS
jgi:hypothetical protein